MKAAFDITPLLTSTSVAFERARDQLRTSMVLDQSGYPAYDILRTGEDTFRITLAVPGFSEQEIKIETRDGSLWVQGAPESDPEHNQFLFRGIPAQAFQRSFQLPEHVRVQGARLAGGLLHIELLRELPEALRPRTIEIQTTDNVAAIEGHSEAA